MNELAATVGNTTRQWAMSARDAWVLLANALLMVALIVALPFDEKTNRGLALATFIAVLWLSEPSISPPRH